MGLTPTPLPWIEPLALAAFLHMRDTAPMALLYSGRRTFYSGRFSLLATGVQDTITADHFAPLAQRLTTHRACFENAWFGLLGYALRHDVELLPRDQNSIIELPVLWMAQFAHVYVFDHETQQVQCWGDMKAAPHLAIRALALPEAPHPPSVLSLHSNFTLGEYVEKTGYIIEQIHAGSLYQANLTRKFHGEFSTAVDSFALFLRLCQASPAPYGAYLRLDAKTAVLSSSPECFLRMTSEGDVTSLPIKGTAPRGATPEEDVLLRGSLAESAKDRAENLMIVDLMRNDFSRGAIGGSVRVDHLFDITTHATLHHLSSTVACKRKPDVTPLQFVRQCFPPGSMTGAPKIRAMQFCSALEAMERGVYSGALGWFGGNGSADLSVVIRTIIVQANRFEFQVGGGIVADSSPEQEWKETMTKAKGMAQALGLAVETLEKL